MYCSASKFAELHAKQFQQALENREFLEDTRFVFAVPQGVYDLS
jgi:hypothetical protein